MGEGKRVSKEKVSTRTMIKKAVRGGKIDLHLRGKKKTFIDLPKIQPNPTQPNPIRDVESRIPDYGGFSYMG